MSLFRRRAIHQNLAMTGEVTLTGRVLPVGGVREKVLAARRAGITKILIPRHNEKDLVELPPEVKADVTFHSIDTLDDVVEHLFPTPKPRASAPKPSPARKGPSTRRLDPPLKPPLPGRDKPTTPGKSARRTGSA